MDAIYKRMKDDMEIEEYIDEGPSRIQKFFSGQTIFLTGCTGFMGKVFVEKLLRTCYDMKRLYLLVRPKKLSSSERMKAYFNNVIFDVMKRERPDYLSKVRIVEGDLIKENMGLSKEDREILVQESTIIYHNASNVKFDERISIAIKINVYGTKYMLDLAKDCKNLLAFFYVSTAYSHCYNLHILDQFYPPPGDMKMMSDIVTADEATSEGFTDEALKEILGKWPNNYSFTKSMAEHLVEQVGKEVNFICGVYRPSMVLPTYKEPIRGWSGNINGPVGIMVGTAIGFLHAMYRAYDPLDLVPADMACNALFAATWDAVTNKKTENEAVVYNYGSTMVNQTSGMKLGVISFERGQTAPSINEMSRYYIWPVNSRWQYWLLHLTVHLIPALIIDFLLLLSGEKPKVFAYWKLLTKNINAMFKFASGNWRIHLPRTQALWDRMDRNDSKKFFCDLRKLDWEEYCYCYWMGLRVYLLKEPLDNQIIARNRYEKVKLVHDIIIGSIVTAILYYLMRWLCSIYGINLF